MAENTLNLRQIQEKLQGEYDSQRRHIVFWYDDEGYFAEDVDNLDLGSVKKLRLTRGNQFAVKRLLEREDRDSHYLLYAPFPKPVPEDNHLEDMLLYSRRFYADRASLLVQELGMEETMKPLVQKHIKFFASKERVQRFLALNIGEYTESSFCLGIMCALCRIKSCSYDELLLQILHEDAAEGDNRLLAELKKYQLLDKFWLYTQQHFGYLDSSPSLKRLMATLLITYVCHYLGDEPPAIWKNFVSGKSGNIMAFVDRLMNNIQHQAMFDSISDQIADSARLENVLQDVPVEKLLEADIFRYIDLLLIEWIIDRLLNEDLGAKLQGIGLQEICQRRMKLHFGTEFASRYDALYYAYDVIGAAHFSCGGALLDMAAEYREHCCHVDFCYRMFYMAYDKAEYMDNFAGLRSLVENIYTNQYLGRLLPAWSKAVAEPGAMRTMPRQRDFFRDYVASAGDRTVVIISDGMRYEVGRQLYERLSDEAKAKVKLDCMLGTLPSYTQMGMAALLPHRHLELLESGAVLADGESTNDLAARAKILQKHVAASTCVQAAELMLLNRGQLREIFTGKQVVYVYHDQIDNSGEHSDNSVFASCQRAVDEIVDLIRKLYNYANTLHFIVTSDHGFIYKRDKVTEEGKIDSRGDGTIVKKRYIVSESPLDDVGIYSVKLGEVLNTADGRYISLPSAGNVFKARGGSYNYVHGGSSPQEMLLPVLDVKLEKYHLETTVARISVLSLMNTISSLRVTVEFFQAEPVGDIIKETSYRICFVDEAGNAISNENIYVADSRQPETNKRFFRLQFVLKNQQYDTGKQYYLTITNIDSGMELSRRPMKIDIALDNDLGIF